MCKIPYHFLFTATGVEPWQKLEATRVCATFRRSPLNCKSSISQNSPATLIPSLISEKLEARKKWIPLDAHVCTHANESCTPEEGAKDEGNWR